MDGWYPLPRGSRAGTSLPDTFANRTAILNGKTADAAIGNITGSNSVNVFLGLGLPWLIGSAYYQSKVLVFAFLPILLYII